MTRYQLSEQARGVLRVHTMRFRKLVKGLVLRAVDKRYVDLGGTEIVLGRAGSSGAGYQAVAAIPYCKRYGKDLGIVRVRIVDSHVWVEVYCSFVSDLTNIAYAAIASLSGVSVYMTPGMVYYLYTLLYGRPEKGTGHESKKLGMGTVYWGKRRLGTGARPLLDVARQAEQAGDAAMADVLRRLYALLEASKDTIREIEEADYSRAAEEEVRGARKVVEKAVELLREAKRAAWEGDIEGLNRLLDKVVLEVGGHSITLGDVVDYLTGRENERTDKLVKILYRYFEIPRPGPWLKRIDIYDTIITVAEHLGLEVKRR